MIRLKDLLFEQPDEFTNQYNWWVSYLQSPMYIARLKQEFPTYTDQQLNQERATRLRNLQYARTHTQFVKAIGDEPGYISGMMYPKQYTGEYWDYKTKTWKKRKSTDPRDRPGGVDFEQEFNPKHWNPYPGYETIPAHEFGHAVDDGGYRIPASTLAKIYRYTQGGDPKYPSTRYKTPVTTVFDYYSDPTEFINRVQPIRYLLNKQGIYDARKRAFTAADYDKMWKSPQIKNNVHFQDVFNSLKGSDAEKKKNFIDIMNSIAQMPIPTSDQGIA